MTELEQLKQQMAENKKLKNTLSYEEFHALQQPLYKRIKELEKRQNYELYS